MQFSNPRRRALIAIAAPFQPDCFQPGALQAETDRWLIDAFLRRALAPGADPHSFWRAFVDAFTRELHARPDGPAQLRLKTQLARHWLRAFLRNFYEDSAEVFYWQPGELRQAVYHAGLELGVQILPTYPYSPAPDPRTLPVSLWSKPSDLAGLRIDIEKCSALVRTLAQRFRAEYEALPHERPAGAPPWSYHLSNGFYGSLDGCILYAMIRRFRPRHIVEIGSGNSTYLAAHAAARNQRDDPAS